MKNCIWLLLYISFVILLGSCSNLAAERFSKYESGEFDTIGQNGSVRPPSILSMLKHSNIAERFKEELFVSPKVKRGPVSPDGCPPPIPPPPVGKPHNGKMIQFYAISDTCQLMNIPYIFNDTDGTSSLVLIEKAVNGSMLASNVSNNDVISAGTNPASVYHLVFFDGNTMVSFNLGRGREN